MKPRAPAQDARVVILVEALDEMHVRQCIERGSPGQHQPVGAGAANEVVDHVE